MGVLKDFSRLSFFFGYIEDMQAHLSQSPLTGARQTASEMVNLVRAYSSDIGPKAAWPLPRFFNYVKNLEFRPDPKGHESISRPAISMQPNWPWRDCDDKSILIGSYCYQNKIPFFFRATSKRKDKLLHHVFVVARVGGKDVTLDATYPSGKLGKTDPNVSSTVNLTGAIMPSPTLSVFSGDETEELSGFFSKIKKVGKASLTNPLLSPGGALAAKAFKNRKKLLKAGKFAVASKYTNPALWATQKAAGSSIGKKLIKKSMTVAPGGSYAYKAYDTKWGRRIATPGLSGVEELGSFKSLMKKAKKVSRKAKKVGHSVLKMPGVRDLVKATPAGALILKAGQMMDRKKKGLSEAMPEISASERPAWMIPAAVGGGALLLILLMRGRK